MSSELFELPLDSAKHGTKWVLYADGKYRQVTLMGKSSSRLEGEKTLVQAIHAAQTRQCTDAAATDGFGPVPPRRPWRISWLANGSPSPECRSISR